MKPVRIKVESLVDPLGVDFLSPTISWNCEGGKKQTAYRLKAYNRGEVIYDSKKVDSNSMKASLPVALTSREEIDCSITLFNENGLEGEEGHAHFEMGLLKKEDWKGDWISGDYSPSKKKRYPVDCFRKHFVCKRLKKARLYITACGLYEAKINGVKAGDFVLSPGVTDYRVRVQYQTYDVTALINEGNNQITVELADGWYRGSVGAWGIRCQYGKQTKFLAQLELEYENGESEIIATDNSWCWSNDGPIRFADNKDGEILDLRMSPSYNGRARVVKHNVVPSCSNNVPLNEHEIFSPEVIKTPSGKTVLDFKQNIAGYIAFKVEAKAGQEVFLRFGELLGSDGEFTQKNIQCANKKRTRVSPLQQVKLICKDGENVYKTKFAIFGFRYALLETEAKWNPDDFKAIAVYSSMEETLRFDCSSTLINKFVENTRWSAKNNHADLPTDCPTRERHGWTGDAQIFSITASYFFDYDSFARKYQRMLVDEQDKKGVFPQIVPTGGVDFYMKAMNGSSGWSDAGIIIPYNMWKVYGDEKILLDNYEAMSKYADTLIKKIGKWYITAHPTGIDRKYKKYLVNYGQAYGEWAEPDDVHHMTWRDCAVPHPEVATAYTSYVLGLMGEIADHLGKPSARYKEFSSKTKQAYQALRKTDKFKLDTDRQAELARPLYFDLLDAKQKEYAKERLVKALENYSWRVGTGFLSTPLILYVLEDINIEYAYRLLENERMPGWLFMPLHGATTIWEAWEGDSTKNGGIASLNHYSKGAACQWIFQSMCGIRVDGENHFFLAPRPGGSLTHASCEYLSVYGLVKSSWKKESDKIIFSFEIPTNTSAKALLFGEEKVLETGEYRFEYNLK